MRVRRRRTVSLAQSSSRGDLGRRVNGRVAFVRRAAAAHPADGGGPVGHLLIGGFALPCALGRSGLAARKQEGDGATPLGRMAVLGGRFRADRCRRPEGNPGVSQKESFWSRIDPADGWCDAPFSANYNRAVRLPFAASHETLMRTDHLYDRLIILDWNIRRRKQGTGSAIFLHQARIEAGLWKPTEGCIALEAQTFRRWAARLACVKAIHVL